MTIAAYGFTAGVSTCRRASAGSLSDALWIYRQRGRFRLPIPWAAQGLAYHKVMAHLAARIGSGGVLEFWRRDLTGYDLGLSTGPWSVLLLRLAAGHHTPCVTHPGKSGLQIARSLWFRGHRRGCCGGLMQGASGSELAGADVRLLWMPLRCMQLGHLSGASAHSPIIPCG